MGSLILLGAALAAPAQTTSDPTDKPTCAVLNLDAPRIDSVAADQLTSALRSEMIKDGQYVVLSREKMKELMDEQSFSRSCWAADCALEAGNMLSANYIIYGAVRQVESTYFLTTELMNVESRALERSGNTQANTLKQLITFGAPDCARQMSGIRRDIVRDRNFAAADAESAGRPPNTLSVRFSNPPGSLLYLGGRVYDLNHRPVVYLALGPHAFEVVLADDTRLYGRAYVLRVDENTEAVLFGTSDGSIFKDAHVTGALEGRPVRYEIDVNVPSGEHGGMVKVPAVRFELSLVPTD